VTRAAARVGALALVVGLAAGIGALSQAPWTAEPGREAVLRLAWRARGQRVERCRRLTPEELERLPVHMRVEEECERRVAPYRLDVVLDGGRVVAETVHSAGAREDRPLYVFRDLRLPAGPHAVGITFAPADPGAVAAVALSLDTTLVLDAGRVVLVTHDGERRQLVVR
jgi:hypothetical protein